MRKQFLFVLLSLATMLLCSPAVVFAQWEPDVRLTYNDSASQTSVNNSWCVAATGDTVHVVWWDNRDGNWEIYTKRSTNGGTTWGPDLRLTNNSAYSWYPSVTAFGSNVHVVWEDSRDGNWEIYTKRSTDRGATWGPDIRLTNNSAGSFYPSVAASGSNVHIVWNDSRDGNPEIYHKRSTNGGTTWGPDLRLTNDSAISRMPSLAVSGSNVHVVWPDFRDGNDEEIYYKRSSDGGTSWGSDIRLTDSTGGAPLPSVVALGSNVHVVWADGRVGNFEVYTKRSTDGGLTWEPDLRLTNDRSSSDLPSVTAFGSNVHVVWEESRDGNLEIYTKHSTDWGTTWGPDTRLTNDGAWSYHPTIASSELKVHVVWYDTRDGNNEIYYKRNPTGNSGIEENNGFEGSKVRGIKAIPNPFSSFATVPGHSSERFALYDVSGRRVGTYKGDRIGEGLRAGVYFLRADGKDAKPMRIVKVR